MTGTRNVGFGSEALTYNTTGLENTALGAFAQYRNEAGHSNTAVGHGALAVNVSGDHNIAVGHDAGNEISGNYNIVIGNAGNDGENATIRLGDANQTRAFIAGIRGKTTGSANAISVVIDSNGQLGTLSSSASTKDDIADMNDATDDLMKLRPVTFHYKSDHDPAGRTLQYGLVAEEVERVYPGLVAHSPDGSVETVMYQFLPPMLLNEVQKQRRTIEALEAKLAAIEKRIGGPGERR
jgi:hypothetical protein